MLRNGSGASLYQRYAKTLAWSAVGTVVVLTLLANLGYAPRLFRLASLLPGRDFTGHFLLMGMLSFFVNMGLASQRVLGRRLGVAGLTLILLVALALDEASHLLLSHRAFEWSDLAASYAGALVFAAVAAWLQSRRSAADPALDG